MEVMTMTLFDLAEKMDVQAQDIFVYARKMFGKARDNSATFDHDKFTQGSSLPLYVQEYLIYHEARIKHHLV